MNYSLKKFPGLECNAHPTPIADCDTQNEYVSSGSSNKHGTMNEGPYSVISGNDFTVQQQTTSLTRQDNLCGEDSLQNKGNSDDKQSDSTGEEQREATITMLPTKKHLPSINNQYAIALNCLVLFFFIPNEIKQSNKRQM
ncbi:hypothetical protein RclHR1_00010047 [Rhizophagus clarus]|uniref:Uncharacterized protein n=1 Tax=Rhizophagus clarus TaxID=94130 RepID=A0A2Z6Q192_9GLOM|nr:hypothetical protein RclHR1_00010047 [Rhizophagus clarus]